MSQINDRRQFCLPQAVSKLSVLSEVEGLQSLDKLGILDSGATFGGQNRYRIRLIGSVYKDAIARAPARAIAYIKNIQIKIYHHSRKREWWHGQFDTVRSQVSKCPSCGRGNDSRHTSDRRCRAERQTRAKRDQRDRQSQPRRGFSDRRFRRTKNSRSRQHASRFSRRLRSFRPFPRLATRLGYGRVG